MESERVGRLRNVSTNLSVSAFFACSAGETERLRVSGRLGFSASMICCDDGFCWAIAAPAGRTSATATTERTILDFSLPRCPDMVLSPMNFISFCQNEGNILKATNTRTPGPPPSAYAVPGEFFGDA